MPSPKTPEAIQLWKDRLKVALKGRPSPMKGKKFKMSEEHKKRISESLKKYKRTKEHQSAITKSLNDKCKIRPWVIEQNKRLGGWKGERNPKWKGGITIKWKGYRTKDQYKNKIWRLKVLERDNKICQKCKKTESKWMVAHHIQNFFQYPKLRYDVTNGITFCRNCHYEFHKEYSTRGNNALQLIEFIKYGKL